MGERVERAPDNPNVPHKCECDDSVEAIILYPSLGMPMVLAPGQKKCNLIIATGEDALKKFAIDSRDGLALAGTKYIDRHLRLYDMAGPKPLQQEIPGQCLFGDFGAALHDKAQKYVKVWHLGGFKPGKLVRDQHGAYVCQPPFSPVYVPQQGEINQPCSNFVGERSGHPFGVIAPQFQYAHKWLTQLWEVEIDLDGLKKATKLEITSAAFMSWSWLIKKKRETDKENKNYFFAKENLCYEPQDRDIDAFLQAQCDPKGQRHFDYERLFECAQGNGYPEFKGKNGASVATRLQSWHPVIQAATLPLKIGHFSDMHINVRQSVMGNSPAKVIEDGKEDDQSVGGKVCHSFLALKALIEKTASKTVDTALLLTGDYIDYNRNINPEKVSMKIGEQWKAFNILANADNPDLYQRGIDDMLIYSLVRNAYKKHRLPVFMTTGNHEALAMPYGISPRSNSWAFDLGIKELLGGKKARESDSTKAHRQNIKAASEWDEGRADERIPADHNLTIYEAILAYGPTYAQTYHAQANIDAAQNDWFHLLFTPFCDSVLPLGSVSEKRLDTRQILVLLGWGQSANFLSLTNYAKHTKKSGSDQRGAAFLTAANGSLDKNQLRLLEHGKQIKAAAAHAPFVVGTHFTVFCYEPGTTFLEPKKGQGKQKRTEGRFTPHNGPRAGNVIEEWQAQYNAYNWGGCELGLQTYLTEYQKQKGGVDWHFAGHSHRAGVYHVLEAPAKSCGFDPELEQAALKREESYGGTRFVVSGSAGPIGLQNLEGELSGFTFRPPSGSLVDMTGKGEIVQVKTLRPKNNERPRLCVALDYLYVTGNAEFRNLPEEIDWPLRWIETERPYARAGTKTEFLADRISLLMSTQVDRLKCLDLENMKLWVFKSTQGDDENDIPTGEWLCLPPTVKRSWGSPKMYGRMEWHLSFASLERKKLLECVEEVRPLDLSAHRTRLEACRKRNEEAENRRTVALYRFEKAIENGFIPKIREAQEDYQDMKREVEKQQEELRELKLEEKELYYESSQKEVLLRKVVQAFCEIPLKAPQTVWSPDMNCEDPWIFPLEIAAACSDDDRERFLKLRSEQAEDENRLSQVKAEQAQLKKFGGSLGIGAQHTNAGHVFNLEMKIKALEKQTSEREKKLAAITIHEYIRRPKGERGEIPDWRFLADYFSKSQKGYPSKKEVIERQEKSPDEGGATKDRPSEI